MLQAAKYIGSGLATIGLTKQLLAPVLSTRLLCPSVISPLAKEAICVVDEMLRSLPEDSPVLAHITEVASQSESLLQVIAKANGGLIIPSSKIEFPDGNIPQNTIPVAAGVYIFTENVCASGQTVVRQAIGSSSNFKRRLVEHKEAFNGSGSPTSLHNFGKALGGISAFN